MSQTRDQQRFYSLGSGSWLAYEPVRSVYLEIIKQSAVIVLRRWRFR